MNAGEACEALIRGEGLLDSGRTLEVGLGGEVLRAEHDPDVARSANAGPVAGAAERHAPIERSAQQCGAFFNEHRAFGWQEVDEVHGYLGLGMGGGDLRQGWSSLRRRYMSATRPL